MASKHLSEEDDKRIPVQSHLEDLEYSRSSDGPGLVNILHGVPKEALYNAVEAFTAEHGLQDSIQAFKKGALVAQKPHDFDNIDELTSEDKEALRYEVDHKWKQTGPLYFTGESTFSMPANSSVMVCAIGAACQGWDQTGSNGASEFMDLSPGTAY